MAKLKVLALQANIACWIGLWGEWFAWGKGPAWLIAFGVGIVATALCLANKEWR